MSKMPESSEPREFIEITIHPDGRMDLMEFTRALSSLNSEYRQWLREHPDLDHTDQDLRLFIEKIQEGSVKIWITKAKDHLIDSLGDFYKDYLDDCISSLIKGADDKIPIGRLKNIRALVRWKMEFRYRSPRGQEFSFDNDISLEAQAKVQNEVKKLLAGKDVTELDNEAIKFAGFHRDSNAKVIVPAISEDEVKTFLAPDVREFFLKETENFLHPEKEYLVNLEITYKQDDIESYYIKEVKGV